MIDDGALYLLGTHQVLSCPHYRNNIQDSMFRSQQENPIVKYRHVVH